MAVNTNNNTRKGAVKKRSQYYNEDKNTYLKRDRETGRFISGKSTPYKGVSKENPKNSSSKTKSKKSFKKIDKKSSKKTSRRRGLGGGRRSKKC